MVAFHWVVDRIGVWIGWRLHQSFVGFNLNIITDHYVGIEDLILVLLTGHLIAVFFAAVASIHSEVDALAPHTLVGVVDVESILSVNLFRVNITSPVPKSQAFGFLIIFVRNDLDLLVVMGPKWKILDDLNREDFPVISRFSFLKLCVNLFPEFACLV